MTSVSSDGSSCSHYRRKCLLVAPCCSKSYNCRICHDEHENHKLDRKTVETIKCLQCSTKQKTGINCIACGILFGKYSCLVCRLFDDTDKKQFHCDGCGICRVGGRDNFFHCPTCDMCLPIGIQDTHKCIEDISRRNCPVCLENIHDSRSSAHIPSCAHMLHRTCLDQMLEHGQSSCPICNQSLIDMTAHWQQLDTVVENTLMPEAYRNYHVNVLCRDCHKESKILFHVIGLKCADCGSYNTTRIGGDDPLPFDELGQVIGLSDNMNIESNDEDSWETVSAEDEETVNARAVTTDNALVTSGNMVVTTQQNLYNVDQINLAEQNMNNAITEATTRSNSSAERTN